MSADNFFQPYPKMVTQSTKWFSNPQMCRKLERTKWVVTEKIHGANMSFMITPDSREIRAFSRRRFVKPHSGFFAFEPWLESHQARLLALFDRVIDAELSDEEKPKFRALSIFGELFGGKYPHPDVLEVEGISPVQTGVWYSPDVRFAIFDLRIDCGEENGAQRFLPFQTTLQLCAHCDLLHAPLLATFKTLNEAIDFPVDFPSHVPKILGLPPSPESLPAEGIVVRPLSSEILVSKEGHRAIVKKKSKVFMEDLRFHQAQAPTAPMPKFDASSQLDLVRYEMQSLLCPQRIESALSKLGPVDIRVKSSLLELLKLVVQDVFDEITETMPDVISSIPSATLKSLRIELRQQSKLVINQYYQTNR